jgi:predicted NAD/FAD-binding protein
LNVAVIGGGYAGMAAAVALAQERVPVTVFEAGKVPGGRARRIEHPALTLDNGLHILIGAYVETLRLMRLVGADPDRLLLRTPFSWNVHKRFSLAALPLPAPFHLAGGLARSRGLSVGERFSVARFLLRMRSTGYRLPRDTSVAELLRRERQAAAPRAPAVGAALRVRPQHATRGGLGAGIPERAARHTGRRPRRERSPAAPHRSHGALPRAGR